MKSTNFARTVSLGAACAAIFWLGSTLHGGSTREVQASSSRPQASSPQVRGRSARGTSPAAQTPASRPIHVLFLGDDRQQPHQSAKLFQAIAPSLARRGIQLTHVGRPEQALTSEKLAFYDAILIYGDQATLSPANEKALIAFVESGKGVVAIHSAAAMFTGSEQYAALIGAQLQRSGTGEFTGQILQPNHPVVQGVQPFATTDETYVFTKENPLNRTVLMERTEGAERLPLTWVRTQGKGHVFYTAYGHDEKTWTNANFQKLIENGIVWSVDEQVQHLWQNLHMPEVAYLDGYNVPNYEQRTPAPRYQLPFSPADAQKFIQTPAEFKVELFASEPDLVKPIAFTFDERGRLWAIEARDYPNTVLYGNRGDDMIKILEDTNGDGRADKVTIFADGINLASSLVLANGGLIVAAMPHFLFLKDTNGDDKADVREILSTGWGTGDTHAGPSNLQYGPDNYVWGTVGYSGFRGNMNGKPMQFTQGAYRFKPDGSNFEYMTQSTNNTWGIGFNETFDVFGSTANGDPSWYLGIPNRFFDGLQGLPAGRNSGPGYQSLAQYGSVHYTTPYIRQVDFFNFYTAGAGHMFYTARAFPKEYWNRIAFINEPTVHIVGQGVIEPDGAGYVTRDGWNLMSSAEEWFAPIAAMVGPDGAVWVSDWYNFIAQHNPTPTGYTNGRGNAYETSMRDRFRGRIYRVVYKGAPAAKPRSLSKTDTAGLLDALTSDNMFWRLTAQRLIVERGKKDIVPQLLTLVRNKSVDAIGTNGGALHALWTLQGLGELNTPTTEAYRAAVDALKHPAAGVRKAAAMVLPHTPDAGRALLASGVLQDPDLHTRLAATLVLAEMPASAEIGQALYRDSQKAENYSERWLSRAFYIAANHHLDGFVAAYRADRTALPFSELGVPLRIGSLKPDWRQPSAQELSSAWKDMAVPGDWKTQGLPGFDGVVWFTRAIDVPPSNDAATLSLGTIRNMAEVWINGVSVSVAPQGGAPGGGRGGPPTYAVPAGTLHAGSNTITVRVQNSRAEGGFIGQADSMYVQAGQARVPIAGTWKYRPERQTNIGTLYSKPGELAAHVAFNASGGASGAAGAALPPIAPQAPDVVLRLGVVPQQMKFDTAELTVTAGQLVEIVFTNTDAMQHNFVLGSAVGSLQQIGAAADQMAQSPSGLAQQYVPEGPLVLASTRLLDPGQTVRVQFRAPGDPGQYPYVCTFPAHWRLMNGVLNVVAGGRGRGRGAFQ